MTINTRNIKAKSIHPFLFRKKHDIIANAPKIQSSKKNEIYYVILTSSSKPTSRWLNWMVDVWKPKGVRRTRLCSAQVRYFVFSILVFC